MDELNFENYEVKQALVEFEQLVEDTKANQESLDVTIKTNSHEVQGALLELIDNLELDHEIKLGGVVSVSIE